MRPALLVRSIAPALIWMLSIFLMSTDMGSAEHTNSKLDLLLAFLFPHFDHSLTPEARAALHYGVRKTAHVTEYAILCGLLIRAVRRERPALLPAYLIWAWVLATVYAASDEAHQILVHSRTPKVTDVLIDSGGAVLGAAVYALVQTYGPKRRRVNAIFSQEAI